MRSMKYLSLSQPPINTPALGVYGLAIREKKPGGMLNRPTGDEHFLVTFFHTDAQAQFQGTLVEIPPNTLLIWKPGTPQVFGREGQAWSYSWVLARGKLFIDQYMQGELPCHRPILFADPYYVETFFEHLRYELLEKHPVDSESVIHLFTFYFFRAIRTAIHPSQLLSSAAHPFTEIKRYIETSYPNALSLESLAERLNLSASYFRHQFKRHFGISPINYLVQVRMRSAEYLLRDHNLRISQIAKMVGYEDPRVFSILFHRHFGVSPRAMRATLTASKAQEQFGETLKAWEVEQLIREGWVPVLDDDYTQVAKLDSRLAAYCYRDYDLAEVENYPAPERVTITNGRLCLEPAPFWTNLRWEEELAEEVKVEVTLVNTPPHGPNFGIAVSGDTRTGYRLRIYGYTYVVFETARHGIWEALYRCPITLDPQADAYRIALWRSGNTYHAEVDGRQVMAYADPYPPHGPEHRRFALCRQFSAGGADICRLRVWVRKSPQYVDMLEPGRILLRCGHYQDASEWFAYVARTYEETAIRHEAQYLFALALPEMDIDHKEAAFFRVIEDRENSYRLRALRSLLFFRLQHDDLRGAVDTALQLVQVDSAHDTLSVFTARVCQRLKHLPLADRHTALAQLARLPVTTLDLTDVDIAMFAPLREMPLTELLLPRSGGVFDLSIVQAMPLHALTCIGYQLANLSLLTGLPLQKLDCPYNRITDLSPLTGLPLQELDCSYNRITDLSPLQHMPLVTFSCQCNGIHDLTPLNGMSLRNLNCTANAIEDLSPLRGMPLFELKCGMNRVRDLSPLCDLPLKELQCNHNRITDLTPVRHLQLHTLDCRCNAITDLTPLLQSDLRQLFCAGNPLTDLTPLQGLPLNTLDLGEISVEGANGKVVMSLPLTHIICSRFTPATLSILQQLSSLRYVNHHRLTHVQPLLETFMMALSEWDNVRGNISGQGTPCLASPHADLRPFATPVGARAYLAIPLRMDFDHARAFCHYQRGRLLSPSTEEKYREACQYLATVVEPCDPWIVYHLGLLLDRQQKTWRWDSGAPYTWSIWNTSGEEEKCGQDGHAGFQFFPGTNTRRWSVDTDPCYVVIEWDSFP
ncbi:MAG: helix-turn-helix domain-containing protein [Armatimonadota bacterium]